MHTGHSLVALITITLFCSGGTDKSILGEDSPMEIIVGVYTQLSLGPGDDQTGLSTYTLMKMTFGGVGKGWDGVVGLGRVSFTFSDVVHGVWVDCWLLVV